MEAGYDRLTMDAVAREARASKATLYRRWESKASLVVEALPGPRQHRTSPSTTPAACAATCSPPSAATRA